MFGDLLQQSLAADERCRDARQIRVVTEDSTRLRRREGRVQVHVVIGAGGAQFQCRILDNDAVLERDDLETGIEAEFLAEDLAEASACPYSLRLSA